MDCPSIPLELFVFSGILNIVLGIALMALTALRPDGTPRRRR